MYIQNEELKNIVSVLKKVNFNDEQIKRMLKKYKKYKEDVERLEECYTFYYQKMKEFGYSEFETIELAIYRPRIIFSRFYRKKDINPNYKEYLQGIKEEILTEKNELKFEYDEVIKVLKELNLSDEKIQATLRRMKDILFISAENLRENIKYLFDNGLSREDLVTIIERNSTILEYSQEDYEKLLLVMKDFDMNMSDLIDIFRTMKKYFSFNIESTIGFFLWAKDRKLDKHKVKINIKKTPITLHIPTTSFDDRINNFVKLGFEYEDIISITNDAWCVITNDTETLKDKMDVLNQYNLSEEEKRKVIINFPGYLKISVENLEKKLKTAEIIGTLNYVLAKPKNLIQSSSLTIARAYFIKNVSPNLTGDKFARYVYTSEEAFIKKYGYNNTAIQVIYRKNLSKKMATKVI